MYVMDIDGSNLRCITESLDQTPSPGVWGKNSSGVISMSESLVKVMSIMRILKEK